MVNSTAFVPYSFQSQTFWKSGLALLLGVIGISVLSQVSIPLPFSPVPLTGQTFAVTCVALLYGRRLGLMTALSYLGLGSLGLPVFANYQAGLGGPTTGYLVGMMAAVWVVGALADRGFALSFKKAMFASLLGTALTFGFGLIGLSYFVPSEALLFAGVIPFIPGELIKMTLAASMVSTLDRRAV
jgi:biotin transport system substrate-specific component